MKGKGREERTDKRRLGKKRAKEEKNGRKDQWKCNGSKGRRAERKERMEKDDERKEKEEKRRKND